MGGSSRRAAAGEALPPPELSATFWRGFVAILPLWAGAVPIGIAYAVAAHSAGLAYPIIQLLSVTVFSAAAQVSAIALLSAGAPPIVIVGTAIALNAQLPLLGLAVGQQLRLSWPQRLAVASVLTDGAYGVSAARAPLLLPLLLGAGVSMFVAWNAGTALGALAGGALPDPRRAGVDLVAPLTFLAVLAPLVRTRTTALVVSVAGVTALALAQVAPGGAAVLGAGLAGCAAGAWRTRNQQSADPARGGSEGGAV